MSAPRSNDVRLFSPTPQEKVFKEVLKQLNELLSQLDYRKLALYLPTLDLSTREALGKIIKDKGIVFTAAAEKLNKIHPEAELITHAVLHHYLPTYVITEAKAISTLEYSNDHLVGDRMREAQKALLNIICADLDKKPDAHYLVSAYLKEAEGKFLLHHVNYFLSTLHNFVRPSIS